MPADPCPLCAAPGCSCPRELVDLARQAVDAQGLAIRPLLIKVLAQQQQIQALIKDRVELIERSDRSHRAQRERIKSLETELAELRKPLAGELGEIEREHAFVQRFVDKLSEVGNDPAHLQIDAINRGGHAHRGALLAEVHRLQAEREKLERALASAHDDARNASVLAQNYETERDEALRDAVQTSKERDKALDRARQIQDERDALAVEVAAARTAIKEAGKEALARVRAKVEGLERYGLYADDGCIGKKANGEWLRRSAVLSILSDEAGEVERG